MKLFYLYPKENIKGENPWSPWYDKVFAFVVRAETEEEARKIAQDAGGDETDDKTGSPIKYPWLDADLSECDELTAEGNKGVIIRDCANA